MTGHRHSHTTRVPAEALVVGDYAVEDRRRSWGWERVGIRVTWVEVERFVSYGLDDGSRRQLDRKVEVEVMRRWS